MAKLAKEKMTNNNDMFVVATDKCSNQAGRLSAAAFGQMARRFWQQVFLLNGKEVLAVVVASEWQGGFGSRYSHKTASRFPQHTPI